MKKTIVAFILGGILFSTITATAAYVYTARDIGYEPQDNTWNVTNADQALTSLKEDLDNVNTNVTEYKQQITEALADKGVEVNENSSMADITSGITNMGATDVYYLGEGQSFNLATLFPNDYQNFTTTNFIVESSSSSVSCSKGGFNTDFSSFSGSSSYSVSKSYNSETGVLTCKGSHSVSASVNASGASKSNSTTSNCKVYLVVGSIESVN